MRQDGGGKQSHEYSNTLCAKAITAILPFSLWGTSKNPFIGTSS
jgi:hypothetical protein